MKPPAFAYSDPHSLPEALGLLAQYGDEGKVLAGGQSLVPLLNLRLAHPAVLIDLNRIDDLTYIRTEERDGIEGLAIGAMTRHSMIEQAADRPIPIPLLHEAMGYVGHPQIRNRGTIGGSIAHADPSAELPLVFRALDGVATIRSTQGDRLLPASEFFLYTFTTSIEPDELLTEIWLPKPSRRTGHAFVEVARRHGDFALIAVAVSLTLAQHGVCTDVRIAIGGAAPTPIRALQAEEAIHGQRASLSLFREAGNLAIAQTEPTSDVHADAAYRRDVVSTLTFRALTLAFERVPEDDA